MTHTTHNDEAIVKEFERKFYAPDNSDIFSKLMSDKIKEFWINALAKARADQDRIARRVTIKDLAPNGITVNMVAVTKKPVNRRKEFRVASVDFSHDLVALDIFGEDSEWVWYRTEELEAITTQYNNTV